MKVNLGSGFMFDIHPEGIKFIAISGIITLLILIYDGFNALTIIGLLITVSILAFFRDPERVVPQEKNIVISPADGKVVSIGTSMLPKDLNDDSKEEYYKISIFLNVFNVHVNRIPVSGVVDKMQYKAGQFMNASLDKASDQNERNIIMMKNEEGDKFVFTQIAGFVARRIVSYASQNETYSAGERYGIIKFGSRMDVFIPKTYKVNILENQTMIGGETILAKKIIK